MTAILVNEQGLEAFLNHICRSNTRRSEQPKEKALNKQMVNFIIKRFFLAIPDNYLSSGLFGGGCSLVRTYLCTLFPVTGKNTAN
ncbi:hypothetical protein SAMN04515620_13536 [Collimonas sp. OK607]|uniref:hypothetical protein n=1 Tax=Collimonas sp. OK607 TaxID=1798194 RepID=UPI0008F3674B|nr:hypothetical protein [Collimonas sp. OK607]SFB28621.1 hypothetical protein SAMN04515620_13536 [Collimonas sp. OK607]